VLFHQSTELCEYYLSLPQIRVNATYDYGSMHSVTALHLAASCGKFKFVRLLIDAGADKSAKLLDGRTPLDCVPAYSRSRDELCSLLK
jgi:ankyrin repeat protein